MIGDAIMLMLVTKADTTLSDLLKEIIPPVGHRILILSKFKEQYEAQRQGQQETGSQGHDQAQTVQCPFCQIQLNSLWKNIWSHLQIIHNQSSRSQTFKCPCGSSFVWFSSFKRHFTTMHSSQQISTALIIILVVQMKAVL
jgi:hypothetical protein